MPVFGVKNSKGCFLVIAEGYKYEMNVVFGVKEGLYYIYPRFIIQEQDGIPYENISIFNRVFPEVYPKTWDAENAFS